MRGFTAVARRALPACGLVSPDDGGGDPGDRYWGASSAVGPSQIGQAAWYGLVGGRTSSGERLDAVTPTAAHRSLPLGSCAKVTELDTGRSVIVTINDRGPFHRRFIIDLSPRAAEELGMRYAGVAAVAVEPVAVDPSSRRGGDRGTVADRGRRVPDRGCQCDAIAPLGPHLGGVAG